MGKRIDRLRKEPEPQLRFGLYNLGNLWSVHFHRRDAIKDAERITGKPWRECRQWLEIHKVRVERYSP